MPQSTTDWKWEIADIKGIQKIPHTIGIEDDTVINGIMYEKYIIFEDKNGNGYIDGDDGFALQYDPN